MLVYKNDVLQLLKDKGFSSYKIRQEKLFSQTTIQQIREGKVVCIKSIEKLCEILNCQPGDLIEYKKESQ